MNTISNQAACVRRRRRHRSDEFKADAVAACTQPGMSMAAVALSRGINANLLRRWVREAEARSAPMIEARAGSAVPTAPAAFVPLQLPEPVAKDIRVELRRGEVVISVVWPAQSASECAMWIRELLR